MIELNNLYQKFLSSTGISTDTRKVEKGNIFLALKGPNFNGNSYAALALEKGASHAVVDEAKYAINEQYILVEDGLIALQMLANHHRKQLQFPFIGIAGSNGKTTTKELTHAVLNKKYKTFATKGNLNNHIGVPLTLLSISKDVEIAIIELGANHIGELADLCKICEPTHGLITNIGLDHLEGYGSLEGVAEGNSELFYFLLKNNGITLVNSKDELLLRMGSRFASLIKYGSKGDLVNCEVCDGSYFLKVKTDDGLTIQTNMVGDYNLDNINAALCLGKVFNIDIKDAINAIETYIPSNNRSQLLKKETNSIILDCYNANPSSMMKSIESFSKIKTEKKILMLGDMFEMGEHSEKEHQNMVDFISKFSFNKVFLCGDAFNKTKIGEPYIKSFQERNELEQHLKTDKISGASVLIKGSRGMAMEKLVEYL